uniref:Uncharacterized protein n=1 Tax=Rangifer tarandus platyrhynchus TaxID=3082113 RepID=A0ACB0EIQ0_RANTA|nr:unnamed protein product [Rangifer tarandus platyrhynchus]
MYMCVACVCMDVGASVHISLDMQAREVCGIPGRQADSPHSTESSGSSGSSPRCLFSPWRRSEKPRGPRAPSDGSFKEQPPPPPSQLRPPHRQVYGAGRVTGRAAGTGWSWWPGQSGAGTRGGGVRGRPLPCGASRLEDAPRSGPGRLGGPETERGLAGVRRRGPRSPAVFSRRPRPPRLGGADPGPGRFVPPPPYKAAFVARGLRRTR